MEHPSIDEELVPERYVAEKLSADERSRFEEHFFDCPKCLETVEIVRRLREDLKEMPDAAFAAPKAALPATTFLLAASLLVAVSAAIYFYQAGRGSRRELETLRRATVSAPRPGPAAAAAAARTLASAPLAASVYTLNLTRGGSSAPDNRIAVGGPDHWLVLLFDAPEEIAPGPYRVMVATTDGRPVGRPVDAAASSGGMLAASFPSSLLPPGDYVLTVGRKDLEPADRFATYRFRALPSPAP